MTDDELRRVLEDRIAAVRAVVAGRATLVAVTKTVSPRVVGLLPALGVTDFGENRPQQLEARARELPARWHLVGHLQRNKIDRTIPHTHLVHSVDSERLLQSLAAFGTKRGTPVPVLLEVNCSREPAKGGFAPEAVPALADMLTVPGLEVRGLMTMAAFHDDPEACRPAFAELRVLRDRLREATGLPLPELSMGMSHDYAVALDEGATLVRVGSSLFAGLEAE